MQVKLNNAMLGLQDTEIQRLNGVYNRLLEKAGVTMFGEFQTDMCFLEWRGIL